MSKVLITGATGFLGKYVIEELLLNKYEVVAQGRNKNRLYELKEKYKIDILECDLNVIHTKKLNVDYVIHAAALSTVWGKWEDFYNSNVVGTINVVKFCKKNKVKRLVYVSSPSIYTEKKDRFNINEEDYNENNSLNYYIKSKILAEKVINDAYNEGLKTVIIRPRGLFGIGDTSIIPRLIKANRTIGIPLFNDGSNVVDITCVENVALALRLSLESKKALGKVYNITNGEPTKFKEILEKLFLEIGEEANYRKLPLCVVYFLSTCLEFFYKIFRIYKEPSITKYTVLTLGYSQTLNIDRAKKDLRYKPKMTLEDGIKKYAEDIKKTNK